MEEQSSARQLLLRWLNLVMADKVFFTAIINDKLTKTIGYSDEEPINNLVRIMRNASKGLVGADISSGRITNILIEKKGGLWKIIVFKERLSAKPPPVS